MWQSCRKKMRSAAKPKEAKSAARNGLEQHPKLEPNLSRRPSNLHCVWRKTENRWRTLDPMHPCCHFPAVALLRSVFVHGRFAASPRERRRPINQICLTTMRCAATARRIPTTRHSLCRLPLHLLCRRRRHCCQPRHRDQHQHLLDRRPAALLLSQTAKMAFRCFRLSR